MNKHLHIVAFSVPFPANYGGVIDVFYKIRHLHQEGVKIILHCFVYNESKPSPELEKYCEKVFYYQRNTGLKSNLSFYPYIVLSRKNPELLENLCADNYPILFEGLHTCYYLSHKRLRDRIKYCRPTNVEHKYYGYLSRVEKNILKKNILFH